MSNDITLLSSIIVLSIKHKKNTQDNLFSLNHLKVPQNMFTVIYHKEKHDILILEKLEVLAFCLKNN